MDLSGASADRLGGYLKRIGALLGNKARRASFANYALGLLSEAERKSVEPIAARLCPAPERADAEHQRLLHFVGYSTWSDHEVRREAARYGIEAISACEAVEAWILDDTGWLKQGVHSVGVQRQYTGSAGKVTNCQIGVSLTIATRTDHLPIDFALYLPRPWTEDAVCREIARIPAEIQFETKPELGLRMVRRALEDGVPKGVVLADSAYGSGRDFRAQLRQLGLHYAVGVDSKTKVRLIGKSHRVHEEAVSLRALAMQIKKQGGFRRCTWREGSKEGLGARFCLRRVWVSQAEQAWLLIEWRDGESEPSNYFLSSLPKIKSLKTFLRLVMQRWRIERTYQDLKGELGLDHYEGRSFTGWHHHVTVALCCYAFVAAERARRFSPSASRAMPDGAHRLAA
jgi:SRSO17 transposase